MEKDILEKFIKSRNKEEIKRYFDKASPEKKLEILKVAIKVNNDIQFLIERTIQETEISKKLGHIKVDKISHIIPKEYHHLMNEFNESEGS